MKTKNLPQYQSHKVVGALKIKSIDANTETGTALVTPEEEGFEPFEVGKDYLEKHNPQVGGYYIEYKDGYLSFSPAEPFESGYKKVETESADDTKEVKEHEHDFSIVKGCEEKYCRICDLSEAEYNTQKDSEKEIQPVANEVVNKITPPRKRTTAKKATPPPAAAASEKKVTAPTNSVPKPPASSSKATAAKPEDKKAPAKK